MTSPAPRHFLDLDAFDAPALRSLIESARRRKEARRGRPKGARAEAMPRKGRLLAREIAKPTTRN
ncbi:MAG: ornithine carbamoyltransferase, partial [Alphaproteobacteria bacterium]